MAPYFEAVDDRTAPRMATKSVMVNMLCFLVEVQERNSKNIRTTFPLINERFILNPTSSTRLRTPRGRVSHSRTCNKCSQTCSIYMQGPEARRSLKDQPYMLSNAWHGRPRSLFALHRAYGGPQDLRRRLLSDVWC